MDYLEKQQYPLLYCVKLCASFESHQWIQTGVTVRKRLIRAKMDNFFHRVTLQFDVWHWKSNRAPFLCYFKLCASLHNHCWIQTGVTIWKHSILVKIDDFFSRVNLQLDVWSWKTIGHLCYATSSFVHHFITIGEFKLELQSGNGQFGSNSMIFRAVWPWNFTDDLQK